MYKLAQACSKYSLSDLALRSIVELERMNAGLDCRMETFGALSAALLQRSEPAAEFHHFRFVEPGYYEPFERLYCAASSTAPADTEQLQFYMKSVSARLDSLTVESKDQASELLTICVVLHQELIQELRAEDVLAIRDWSYVDENASSSVGATEN